MPLPHRKKQTKRPTLLPKEFLRTVSGLFDEQFGPKAEGASFLVFGDLYQDEVVLCVSLSHPQNLQAASMHLSSDLPKKVAENPEKVTEFLKSMVDVAASWYSQCFQSGSGLPAVLTEMGAPGREWQEFEWEGEKLHVLLNRTNYVLEQAADSLLKKSGFAGDGTDPLDGEDEDPERAN